MRGNERADLAAKSTLDLAPEKFNIPYTDLKPEINRFIHIKWQKCWNIPNKLFLIKTTLGKNLERKKSLHPNYTLVTQDLYAPFILKQEQ